MFAYMCACERLFVTLQPILQIYAFVDVIAVCTSFKRCRPVLGHFPTKRHTFDFQ